MKAEQTMSRIFIVDDEEENQCVLRTLLEGNGFAVELAGHGAEALQKARLHPPDLIITDILMPVMDGFTLCREWMKDERLRSIPLIFYSATYTGAREQTFALSLGAKRFIVKPAEPDAFLAVIRETLQQVRQPAPSSATPVRLPVEAPEMEGTVYLKQYNAVLIRKLETKMEQLEKTNRELERDIAERLRVEAELEQMHKQMLDASRRAGMAEMASVVLHNVGNVLNSINVASTCVADSLRGSKAANLAKVVALLQEHEADLGVFIASDPQGKRLPGYLAQLADYLAEERARVLKELTQMQSSIAHIREIVTIQQGIAKMSGVTEVLRAADLVEDALTMNASALARRGIQVIKDFSDGPPLTTEKHKVLQILVNLMRNAMQACDASDSRNKKLTLRVTHGPDSVRVAVADNGIGIPPENLTRIFTRGFTTKKDGHGFGLHGSAQTAEELGGSLTAHSDGPGQGAVFTLELPRQRHEAGPPS